MKNPISNLGDYNEMRKMLQNCGGCMGTLLNKIGEDAVSKAAPGLMTKGGLIGSAVTVGIGAIAYGGYRAYHYLKEKFKGSSKTPEVEEARLKAIIAEMQATLCENNTEDGEVISEVSNENECDDDSQFDNALMNS